MHYIKRTPVHNLYNTFEVDDMVVFKSKITYEFSTCKWRHRHRSIQHIQRAHTTRHIRARVGIRLESRIIWCKMCRSCPRTSAPRAAASPNWSLQMAMQRTRAMRIKLGSKSRTMSWAKNVMSSKVCSFDRILLSKLHGYDHRPVRSKDWDNVWDCDNLFCFWEWSIVSDAAPETQFYR